MAKPSVSQSTIQDWISATHTCVLISFKNVNQPLSVAQVCGYLSKPVNLITVVVNSQMSDPFTGSGTSRLSRGIASSILAVDINFKNRVWGCRDTNVNGKCLQSYLDRSNTQIRPPSQLTYYGTYGSGDILDIFLVQATDLIGDPEVWDELSSDHNPIVFRTGPDVPNQEMYETRRTDWVKYRDCIQENLLSVKNIYNHEELEQAVSSLNSSIIQAIKESTSSTMRKIGQF